MSSKYRSQDVYGQLRDQYIYLLNKYCLGHGSLEDVSVTCNLSKDIRIFIRLAREKYLPVTIDHRKEDQCFFFSRDIAKVTPKIIYFYYLIKYFPDQSIQKTFYLILKKEALRKTAKSSSQ